MLKKIEKGTNYKTMHQELIQEREILMDTIRNHMATYDEKMRYNEVTHDINFLESFFTNCKKRRAKKQQEKQATLQYEQLTLF